ncbi:hypothetical protein HYPBUDRAFT_149442 [Hyphopichia burtonii NRRL Y-1933]|uniref:HMG box domain-containing protein n=1 Tax=Hyphopichia burtonii NRRL Y-1933 TaxID=984485 RepID=A0A1E4RH48_9ASCO|nr:hypothetical protein HYPBUDRAFT_149442 [Hyphopichia burtonii NRRL Y-1933]ODV66589.1 hypothetical protein HYPBUDRAFT_149442 [Hyphopichia burtonii NRRL Y-1933]
MKSQAIKTAMSKNEAPESEEQKLKQKCKELKKRITDIEENNEIATIALSRTRMGIRRLRLEYMILLERLEDRAIMVPDGIAELEEMSPPPSPTVLDDSLTDSNADLSRTSLSKKGKRRGGPATSAAAKAKLRDPDLPKRPTNAYLIFCELEKERVKHEIESSGGVVTDLSKTMTEAWRNLDLEKRQPFYRLYEEDRARYQREMVVYNQKKKDEEDEEIRLDESKANKKQKTDSEAPIDDSEADPSRETTVKPEENDEQDDEDIEPSINGEADAEAEMDVDAEEADAEAEDEAEAEAEAEQEAEQEAEPEAEAELEVETADTEAPLDSEVKVEDDQNQGSNENAVDSSMAQREASDVPETPAQNGLNRPTDSANEHHTQTSHESSLSDQPVNGEAKEADPENSTN